MWVLIIQENEIQYTPYMVLYCHYDAKAPHTSIIES